MKALLLAAAVTATVPGTVPLTPLEDQKMQAAKSCIDEYRKNELDHYRFPRTMDVLRHCNMIPPR